MMDPTGVDPKLLEMTQILTKAGYPTLEPTRVGRGGLEGDQLDVPKAIARLLVMRGDVPLNVRGKTVFASGGPKPRPSPPSGLSREELAYLVDPTQREWDRG